MRMRTVGRSGLRVGALALGTMGWGSEVDQDTATELLDAFRDAGGTLLDTAYGYGDGASEEILGSLTASCREEFVLATKAGISRTTGTRVVDTSRGTLLDQLDASLRRLRTDHVDLWIVHAWGDNAPIEETVSAMAYAVSSGRARYVGISNHNGWQLARMATLLQAEGVPVVADQIEYSLVARTADADVLPAAEHLGTGILAWAPLGGGVLTGKYRHGVPADSRAAGGRHDNWARRRVDTGSGTIVDAVATAAEGLRISPVQVALTWLRERPGIATAIVGARTPGQLRMALGSDVIDLPDQVRDALDEVSLHAE
ncbi:aryl-alcohol dehydrogenase-like predicted oxidoreductase [Allobranchiibius huperziae]|uniref:Aryl-alcohol dehydrogenase-like predicted oxidoreductase n=2 Tax=Allobranchiibius huperziae TaxID=1874116 RepID=A0A853DFE8_9MICO|nr:aryl-alcohol dehydrogenase-like predicted oxidoreductase [Allobranchiibius huperziae]